MRTVRIYQPPPLECGTGYELSPAASQHVAVVLRMQPGESLTLFCGDNREFSAIISAVQKKKVILSIHSVETKSRESPCAIHLGQGISKGDRMEWVIQKAVELGVHEITPLLTDRCVVRLDDERLKKKKSQWEGIAISACEQSGRNFLPRINTACTLKDFFSVCAAKTKLVLDPDAQKSWRDFSLATPEMALLIGPEGGLTNGEISHAKENEFQSLRLGPRILRTETAAISALSVLQAVGGDL